MLRHAPRSNRQLFAVVLLTLLNWASSVVAAPIPPPLLIENRAQATYSDAGLGLPKSTTSNITRLQVLRIEALALETDQSRDGTAGETLILGHRLVNQGNLRTDFTVDYDNLIGDDYDTNGLNLIQDLNGNGQIDADEIGLAPGSVLTLMPNETRYFLLSATIPDSVDPGQVARLEIRVVSASGAASATNMNQIMVKAVAPDLSLKKSASTAQAEPGDTLGFRLLAANEGDGPAEPVDTVISGTPGRHVIVRDSLPANTTFQRFDDHSSAEALLHIRGEPMHHYITAPPSQLDTVDAVAFAYPALAPAQRVSAGFQLRLHENAGYRVENEAGLFVEKPDGSEDRIPSNRVAVALPDNPGVLNYFSDDGFDLPTDYGSAGRPLFLGLDSGACNSDASIRERHPVTLQTRLSGDAESGFVMLETGPNTGVFRVSNMPTQAWPLSPSAPENGTVEVGVNDTVVALADCAEAPLQAAILIDPSGVVFDAQSNQTLAGATVTLVGVSDSGAEFVPTVLDLDGQVAPHVLVTNADGLFRFPMVAPGTYRLNVLPPNGYVFASSVPVDGLPANRNVQAPGSYGGHFSIVPASGPVFLDVPLDAGAVAGLMVNKAASRSSASIGETVLYSVTVSNSTGSVLDGVAVRDELPAGFAYLPGTARLEGTRIPDPLGNPGGQLVFTIDQLDLDEVVEVSYRAQLRVGANRGDGVNRVQAFSGAASSNVATATVEVIEDVFRDDGYILGKIFADCNANRIQDLGEPGVPGVRIVLEDGTFVISDDRGKYSFAGVSPRTHVLKVDPITLPQGSQLLLLDNRNMGDPKSQFVDLKKGELHRTDFALGPCDDRVMGALEARTAREALLPGDAMVGLSIDLPVEPRAPVSDPRSRPASGLLRADGRVMEFGPQQPQALNAATRPARLPPPPLTAAATVDLETLLPTLDPALGFIGLKDGDTLPSRQISVLVKGTAGARFQLSVNEMDVSEDRVGQKAVMAQNRSQAWEYIAVKLQPGPNRLTLSQLDPFGNIRGTETITVLAPGQLGRIEIAGPEHGSPADGETPVPIRIDLVDPNAIPVTARTPVTLETSDGVWLVDDLDPVQPGVQTFVDAGGGVFELLPPATPVDALIRVSSGVIGSEYPVKLLPNLRPLLAVGLVEARLDFSRLNKNELKPATKQESFERELSAFSFGDDDNFRGGARSAFYVKGAIKDEYLLTLSYDSDKDERTPLFRDIQPELFYPVYGDAAIKAFDAQSTSKLYARIDKDRSFAQYGDFVTDPGGDVRRLSNYSRSLTGFLGHFDRNRYGLSAFAAHEDSRQVVVEFQARGISGPYSLERVDIVPNSEKVEILTRDREQPSVVLKNEPKERFRDYEVNDLSGELLFRRAVPSVDSNLNPIFIRVTFEVRDDGEDYWIYGVDGLWVVNNWFQLGASMVQDRHPIDGIDLYGVQSEVRVGRTGRLIAEFAQSDTDLEGTGTAGRLELIHATPRFDSRLFFGQSDVNFVNPNAGLTPGRREAGANLNYRIDPKTFVAAELLFSESRIDDGKRRGGLITLQRALGYNLSALVGMRHVRDTSAPPFINSIGVGARDTTTALGRMDWQPPVLRGGSVFLEYEQDIRDSAARRAAVGGEYPLADRGRVYVKHEFIASLTGVYGLTDADQNNHNTVLGLDFDYMNEGQAFSEYRVRDAISGREAEAAIGLRNVWPVARGVRLQTGFERVQPLDGALDESTALTGAVEYTANPLWKGSARMEWRKSTRVNGILNTLGVARKLSNSWTYLGKNTLDWREDRDTDGVYLRNRFRTGLAFRDTFTNRLNALMRYEFLYEKNDADDDKRQTHIWSTHINHRPGRKLTLSGRYAGKYVEERGQDFDSDYVAHLISGRVMYDLDKEWDVGVIGSSFFSGDFKSRQNGVGLEVGHLLQENLWVSAGYNFFGFEDQDLSGEDATNPGGYLRLRYKFDEDVLSWLR